MHQAQILRLDHGKTIADLKAAMKHEGPLPPWLHFVGGPNGIGPGQARRRRIASLAPGKYALVCLIPSPDGVSAPHEGNDPAVRGDRPRRRGRAPGRQDTVRLGDYTFDRGGRSRREAHLPRHQRRPSSPTSSVLLRLAPGKTVKDFGEWAESGMKGPPPALPIGGVAVIDHGDSGVFTADLTPGDYGMICFVPDAKDGKPHLMHGMMKQITVGQT